jgi:transposase-like protein
MAPIDEALEEIESRVFTGQIPYTQIALKHGVVATTLRRRHLGKTQPCSLRNVQQQLLTPEQEIELVR